MQRPQVEQSAGDKRGETNTRCEHGLAIAEGRTTPRTDDQHRGAAVNALALQLTMSFPRFERLAFAADARSLREHLFAVGLHADDDGRRGLQHREGHGANTNEIGVRGMLVPLQLLLALQDEPIYLLAPHQGS